MGSGGGVKKFVSAVDLTGITGSIIGDKAQKDAINAQTEAMERAQRSQREAQEKALEQQRLAQEQTNQANERASRATANINREVKNKGNSADLTGGIAKKANTQGATLGSNDSLGLDKDEDWF